MTTAVSNFSLRLPRNRGEYLLFSLPQTNKYQEIINLATTTHKEILVGKNKVALFTLNDVVKEIKIDFQIKLKPYFLSIDKNYKITDYPKNVFFPNRFINGEDPKIKKMAEKIVAKEKNLEIIIKNLYLFTKKYLRYGKPIEGLYDYKQVIGERTTDCGGFSTFLASLLASQNIPSRLVVGYIVKQNIFNRFFPALHFAPYTFHSLSIHAWLEAMLPDTRWFPIDAATGRFGNIPANRLVTSFDCDFKIIIKNKIYPIDLLQNPVYLEGCTNQNFTESVKSGSYQQSKNI